MQSIIPKSLAFHPVAERITRKLIGDWLEKRYYRQFFKSSRHSAFRPNGHKILIYSGISSMYLTPVEILFYHQLRDQGFEIDYLIYDETVSYNEVTTRDRLKEQGDQFWRRSVKKGLGILDAANVNYQLISLNPKAVDIVNGLPEDTEKLFSFSYEGYEVGDIVKGVMYRFYKSISMQDDAAQVAKEFLKTTLTNYFEIKSRCENNNYHSIMFSHGIYCTWQIIVDYCQKNNLDYICYDRGKTKGCINVNRNNPSPVWDISAAWKRLESFELSKSENQRVDDYLAERETQKGDVYAYNFSGKASNLEQVKQELGIRNSAKVVTIFTNLIWDAANVSRDIAFESPLDCIIQTVNHYRDNPGIHILIRCHPAELVLGTKERYGELVKDAFQNDLPSNLTVIEPEMDINSFTVLDISDIGVVHTSTVGLEMAMEGKPVILISDTHYRGKGFTFDAASMDDYFQAVDMLLQDGKNKNEQVKLARKYFYLMMFEYQHLTPLIYTKTNIFNGFNLHYQTDSTTINKSQMNLIVRAIKEKSDDFIMRP